MITVRVMEMSLRQIVNLPAMRYGRMAARDAVHMAGGMFRSRKARRASLGVCRAHREDVLVVMAIVSMMQVAAI